MIWLSLSGRRVQSPVCSRLSSRPPKSARADFAEAVPGVGAVTLARQVAGVDHAIKDEPVPAEDLALERGIVDQLGGPGVGQQPAERFEVGKIKHVDEIRRLLAGDLDQAEGVVGQRGLDVEADDGFAQ